VPVDMARLGAKVRFDTVAGVAEVLAEVDFSIDGPDGYPVFDLRQDVGAACLDGRQVPPEALAHSDLGAGWDARARVVDLILEAGSWHRLELSYRLGRPEAEAAKGIDWDTTAGGVSWDLGMSDLSPGRYLESWFPANLCHDSLAIELSIEVGGTSRPHLVLANGDVEERKPGRSWEVRYPARFTSLSPLLSLCPADRAEVLTRGPVTVALLPGARADAAHVAADTSAWLAYFSARYGPPAHGEGFLALIWGEARGMEYDGATTAPEPALEHEVFHSWFGRGVKPASARDGWVDEAVATWATASRRAGGSRFLVEELGLDEPPAILCPPHPWSRHTPGEAYATGARLLAGVAHMAGGAAALRAALASWHEAHAGRAASTEDLARHLSSWCGRDLKPWWDRYVYGEITAEACS
jgi:hypothetical protein